MFLILTPLSATNVVPVRRRKEGSSPVFQCFHWKRGEDVFHSQVYLSCEIVDSNDTLLENRAEQDVILNISRAMLHSSSS